MRVESGEWRVESYLVFHTNCLNSPLSTLHSPLSTQKGVIYMFELFLIFCIALIITLIFSQTRVLLPAAIPIVGVIAGGLLSLAYCGLVVPGAVAGLLAAGSSGFYKSRF